MLNISRIINDSVTLLLEWISDGSFDKIVSIRKEEENGGWKK